MSQTWNIAGIPYAPVPRTLALERNLSAVRAPLSEVAADRAALLVERASISSALQDAGDAPDETRGELVADIQKRLRALDEAAEALSLRESEVAMQVLAHVLRDENGGAPDVKWLEENAPIDMVDEVIAWTQGMRPMSGDGS